MEVGWSGVGRLRRGLVIGMAIALMAWGAAPAVADQSPAGCTSNSLDLTVARDRTLVRNGDVVNYTVTVANDAGTACDVTAVTIVLTLPGRDGTLSGRSVTLASDQSYPAGTHVQTIGSVPYTVDVAPGVSDAVAAAQAVNGVLHDAPVNHAVNISKTLGTTVTQPHMTLTKAASTAGGPAPLGVTYTYALVNDSTTAASIGGVAVTDNLCAPVTAAGGDVNANGLLDVAETWTFTCATTHASAGTYVDTANATGVSTFDNRAVTGGPVTATVVVTPSAAPNCVSLPKSLSARARELTTVRVHVNSPAGALVHVSGPGIKRTARTNASGVAVFRVRPTKTGTLTIASDQCLNASKVVVHAARRTSARRVPRVTG
jgi:hypothetical protein